MPIDVIQGTSDKPAASGVLVQALRGKTALSGCLFIGYPIIRTAEGQHPIDALFVSPVCGIVVFDLIEGTQIDDFQARQDDSANKLDTRLRIHRALVSGRHLRIALHTISFAPAAVHEPTADDYIVCHRVEDLLRTISELTWSDSDEDTYRQALSVIENVSSIRRGRVRRTTKRLQSRGAKLAKLERSIATLDRRQNRAVIETVDGTQRIRGLAGSGKTIVLALKAAYLHAQHPDWRIAVTFHTRSLKGIFRQFIEDFHKEQAGEAPDFNRVRIVNAWGSRSDDQPGLYYEFCTKVGTQFMSLAGARARYGSQEQFAGACEAALRDCEAALRGGREVQIYDAILVDEAQDFPPEFLRLCRAFLKKPRRLVYAYDELQNLERDSLPPPASIFGTKSGSPVVSLSDRAQDIVLDKCYRNPGPVLTVAHALGFGIYRTPVKDSSTGLVQMFDNSDLWEDVGYEILEGDTHSGERVTLARSKESSPEFLSKHSEPKDLVRFKQFESVLEQDKWVTREIRKNIVEDELRPNDILVVHLEPRKTKPRTAAIRDNLRDLGFQPYLAGVDGHRDIFWHDDDSIVFSSIHRAKGNEAAMVYVIDAHEQSPAMNLARFRNCLFAAITRSKAWVRVVGVGPRMGELKAEYDRVIDNDFQLRFSYPTAAERRSMRIAHRDRTDAEQKRVETGNKKIASLLADLNAGKVTLPDLDPKLLTGLLRALKKTSL